MTITRIITRESQPCERCGNVRDLTGEYPSGPMICDPCAGYFTCRCCGLSYTEYEGRPEEYKGEPDEYVCPHCVKLCRFDTQSSRCRLFPKNGECRCPLPPGPMPRTCPKCGACNHIDVDPESADSEIVRCEDCGRDIRVQFVAGCDSLAKSGRYDS